MRYGNSMTRAESAKIGTRVAMALGKLVADGYLIELPYTNSTGIHWFCARQVENGVAFLTVSAWHTGKATAIAETSVGMGIEAVHE